MTEQKFVQTAGRAPKDRRRRHIVDPSFQWKYVVSIVVAVFAISALITAAAFGVLYQAAREVSIHPPTTSLSYTALKLVLCSLAFAAAPAAALGLWSIFLTHRICGSLYVLQRSLTEIIEGKSPQRRPLRKKDYFKQLHETFWRAMDAQAEREKKIQSTLDELSALAQASSEGADASRQQVLDAIADRVKSLQTSGPTL